MTIRRKLPPLPAIRSFEAAARHRSFTLAADELHVTQGAVSLQVRKLEEFLGKKLFLRLTRRVELTDDGMEYYSVCRSILEDLEKATERLLARDGHDTLTVSTIPTISVLWLMPRLADFASHHPHIEVRVVSDIRPVDLHRDGVDAAIRVGPLPGRRYEPGLPAIDLTLLKRWDGIQADYLFDDVLVPVMSRELLEAQGPVSCLEDLLRFPLIHTASRPHAWRDWFSAHNVRMPAAPTALDCGHFYISMRAAHEGKGVAIIPDVLLDGYPGAHEMVIPIDPPKRVRSAGEYYLLTRDSTLQSPAVQHFREWILSTAKAPFPASASHAGESLTTA